MTCFHLFRRLMSEMQYLLTPYRFASCTDGSPFASNRLISSTSLSSRTAFEFLDPSILPFDAASRELSAVVPTNRWSGLKHFRLSQWWQTLDLRFRGIPRYTLAAIRCTRPVLLSIVTTPYPSMSIRPFHSQQPDRVTTLPSINRRMMASLSQTFGRKVLALVSPFLHHLA